MTETTADDALLKEARQLLARLSLMSHGTTSQGWNSDGGGRNSEKDLSPSGGVVRKDDHEPDHPQKSHEHYARRLSRANTMRDVRVIVDEMRVTVEAWMKTPMAHAPEPERGSGMWKRWVANQDGPVDTIARVNRVKMRTLIRYREQYRRVA